VAPGGTVTDAGPFRAMLLLRIEIGSPACVVTGAERVSVQEVVAPDPRVVGVQASDFRAANSREIVSDAQLVPKLAFTVASWLERRFIAVGVKVALVAPGATVTDSGTDSEMLSLEMEMGRPAAGAGCERITVQAEVPPEPKLVGEQVNPLTPSVGIDIAPPEERTESAVASGDAATGLTTPIGMVPAAARDRETLTIATGPSPIPA
jgi:hypothetical protein